ncbi:hypothetical protein Taro_047487 [Colocasia esculenta]|uniref:Uncharacterized protein n=1 Tax=Colocasia esculenta TaxID=4460 RepID=A0A843WT29_COLES|nr:hypothetical protein [Colocasia esculenta]
MAKVWEAQAKAHPRRSAHVHPRRSAGGPLSPDQAGDPAGPVRGAHPRRSGQGAHTRAGRCLSAALPRLSCCLVACAAHPPAGSRTPAGPGKGHTPAPVAASLLRCLDARAASSSVPRTPCRVAYLRRFDPPNPYK